MQAVTSWLSGSRLCRVTASRTASSTLSSPSNAAQRFSKASWSEGEVASTENKENLPVIYV